MRKRKLNRCRASRPTDRLETRKVTGGSRGTVHARSVGRRKSAFSRSRARLNLVSPNLHWPGFRSLALSFLSKSHNARVNSFFFQTPRIEHGSLRSVLPLRDRAHRTGGRKTRARRPEARESTFKIYIYVSAFACEKAQMRMTSFAHFLLFFFFSFFFFAPLSSLFVVQKERFSCLRWGYFSLFLLFLTQTVVKDLKRVSGSRKKQKKKTERKKKKEEFSLLFVCVRVKCRRTFWTLSL